MKLTLYRCYDDERCLNKNLATIADVDVSLKSDTDIVNPSFWLSSKNFNNTLLTASYCYVEELNRYYFIRNIVTKNANTCEISCEVDVLMSYQKEIKNIVTLIERQENEFSSYILDNELLTTCERAISMSIIGSIGSLTGANDAYIAVTVAGGSAESEE